MLPCITIGDSIAVGVGQARPDCHVVAKVGITSGRYVASLLPRVVGSAGLAVISLGVNDGDTGGTLENLRTVRAQVQAASVIWLLPGLKPEVRDMIRLVAEENGDRTLDTRPEVGPDHLHPTRTGYERLAAATLGDAPAPDTAEVAYAPDEPPPTRRSHRAARSHHAAPRHGARARRPAVLHPAHDALTRHRTGRLLRG